MNKNYFEGNNCRVEIYKLIFYSTQKNQQSSQKKKKKMKKSIETCKKHK